MGDIASGVSTVVEGVGTMSSTYASSQALKAEKAGVKSDIRGIELGAKQREADRKEALARALASQNALTGAMGITTQGTPSDVMGQDILAEKTAGERDRLMTDIEKSKRAYMMRAKGQMQKQSSLMGYLQGTAKIGQGTAEIAEGVAKLGAGGGA